MKTIEIKSLGLANFKGIKSLEIDGFDKETSIRGANGTGKTTIFDAFCFLLFGKDSTDRKDFEIKTLDEHNNVIPKIDHEVSAVILVDGEEIELKRIFREKWVTRRGSSEAEFSGNETVYYWNDVPVSAGEYATKISGIVDEKVFKLITSPYAFNNLKWQEQREVLINITGGVSNMEIAEGNTDFLGLLDKLGSKSVDEYRKQLAASIRKSKDELKTVPTRIDEVQRGKSEAVDFDLLKSELDKKEESLKSVEDQITDKQKAQQSVLDERAKKKEKIQKLEFQISDIKHRIRQEIREISQSSNSENEIREKRLRELNGDLELYTKSIEDLKSQVSAKNSKINSLEAEVLEFRKKWEAKNAEKFDTSEIDTACPTCHRDFDPGKLDQQIKEAETNFKANKQRGLDRIQMDGKSVAKTIEAEKEAVSRLNDRIENGNKEVAKLNEDISTIQEKLKNTKPSGTQKTEDELVEDSLSGLMEFEDKKMEVEKLSKQLEEDPSDPEDEELKSKRTEIQTEIDGLKSQLSAEVQIKKADDRISQLGEEEKELAQVIANMEKDQYMIECFVKAKIERLEAGINKKFQMVNFKLFETQINGGEVETCKALINGVPYTDANTASKINAGIDIINTLCEFYEVSAPIWIDNRESVIRLIESNSQIINLIVSEADKALRVRFLKPELETA